MRVHARPSRHTVVVVVVVVVMASATALLAAAGCDGAADPCAEKVLYTGGGTDEVLLTLQDAKTRATTNADGPTITSPTAGEALDLDGTDPAFSWDSPLKLAMLVPSSPSPQWVAPVAMPPRPRSLLDRASSLFIPRAFAHEPPVSSDVYLLEIPVTGEECAVTIVTTDLTVSPNADQKAILQAHKGEDLTLSITSAYLQQGRVDEGPYKADPVTFQVK